MRFSDSIRIRWDLFVMILAVWNSFWIPYSVAFEPPSANDIGLKLMNWTIDFLFFVDILIAFRTTYITKNGEEIYEPSQIAKDYLTGGRFVMDFLASVPISDIAGGGNRFLELFGVLKLVRIRRLGKLVAKLDMKADTKSLIKMGMLTFYLILYIHVVACFWFLTVDSDKVWIPPMDWILPEYYFELYTATIDRKYWLSLYEGVLLLIGNEMGPVTPLE